MAVSGVHDFSFLVTINVRYCLRALTLPGEHSGSYRDLLATAEAIVALETQTRSTEDHLSSIGHSCRPPQQETSHRSPPADKVALAQFRLLQRCCTTSTSLLRDQHILQCAQLVVVSRLLLKSLGEHGPFAKSLDLLRTKVNVLRRQLLRQLEGRLISPASALSTLLDALCSYCLVTSVSSEDALARLRQLRLEKLGRRLVASDSRSTICEALQYQLSSLQTFKTLIGRPIVEAMNNLQRTPILSDPAIRRLESLDLDRTFSLIPNDVQSFVPYFKRSAPTTEEMRAKSAAWSREACSALAEALSNHLSRLNSIAEVFELRKDLYMILLPSYFSTPASADIQRQVTEALNKRVYAICQSQGAQLSEITKLLMQGSKFNKLNTSLWDPEIAQTSLEGGGAKFIKQVKSRHAGYSGTLTKATKSLNAWILSANLTQSQINELPKTRWRDILEEPEDEDEDEASNLIALLCEKVPHLYRKSLQDSLHKAMLGYESSITQAASEVVEKPSEVRRAVMLLRSVRVSIASLQQAFPSEAKFEKLDDTLPKLHQLVADEVARQLSMSTEQSDKPTRWDTSTLPDNMPSPRAFSALRRLCKIMLETGGTDLWSPPIVELVKKAVSTQIFDSDTKSWYSENEFDEAYLSIALKHATDRSAPETAETKQIVRSASEYWTRTKLLFGLLS